MRADELSHPNSLATALDPKTPPYIGDAEMKWDEKEACFKMKLSTVFSVCVKEESPRQMGELRFRGALLVCGKYPALAFQASTPGRVACSMTRLLREELAAILSLIGENETISGQVTK